LKRGIISSDYTDYRLGNLSPMYEPIIFAMRPYKKTVTDCILENGLGGFRGMSGSIPSNIFSCTVNRCNQYHVAEKPVKLIEQFIQLLSVRENHVILDFTMGSGTTGVACQNLNRHFIGIEKDARYFDIACNRLGVANSYKNSGESENKSIKGVNNQA